MLSAREPQRDTTPNKAVKSADSDDEEMPDLNTTLKKYTEAKRKSNIHVHNYNQEINEWKMARGKKMSEIWMEAIKKRLLKMVRREQQKIFRDDLKSTKNVFKLTYKNL